MALGLVRKHRLLERFLVDTLKVPWDHVHEEARRLTPVLSDVIADGLAKLLGTRRAVPTAIPFLPPSSCSPKSAGPRSTVSVPGRAASS